MTELFVYSLIVHRDLSIYLNVELLLCNLTSPSK